MTAVTGAGLVEASAGAGAAGIAPAPAPVPASQTRNGADRDRARTATRWVWPAAYVLAAVALFFCYLPISGTQAVTSDGASIAL